MEEYSRKTNSKRNPGSKRNPTIVGTGVLKHLSLSEWDAGFRGPWEVS